MAKQVINIGSVPNDGTGDTGRDGGDKINDNFTELYNKQFTVLIPIALTTYDAEPARSSESNVHGGILSLATGEAISNGTPTGAINTGVGKLFLVINAGSTLTGTVTITGTTIDRDTGTETGADTDAITLNGSVTTDGTTTLGGGKSFPIHEFSNAFMSSKWFTGSVVISTTDADISDFDVYHCSFEQFNDTADIEIDTFDVNLLAKHVNAELDGYLYSVVNNAGILTISVEAEIHIGADGITPIADRYYRLRRSNIAKDLDGGSDGIFIDAHYSNSPAYIEDTTMKVWGIKSQVLSMS